MNGSRKPRAFNRDDAISIRIPESDKNRLKQLARIKRRDTSNLALEFICNGISQLEAQINRTHST